MKQIELESLASVANGETTVPGRWQQLDVLRCVAVLLTLGAHPPMKWPDGFSPPWLTELWFQVGLTGVDLFFVLSGFLVAGLLFVEFQKFGSIDVARFLIRRAFKIWPLYYLYVAVIAVIYLREDGSAWPVLPFVFHVQNYLNDRPLGDHTWSLAIEEHFYLALPVLLAATITCWTARRVMLFAITFFAAQMMLRGWVLAPTTSFLTHHRLDGLVLGTCLAYLFHFHRERFERWARWKWCWWAIGITLVLVAATKNSMHTMLSPTMRSAIVPGLIAIGYGMVLVGCFSAREKVESQAPSWMSWLKQSAMFVGLYSYPIYLWHLLIGYSTGEWLWQSGYFRCCGTLGEWCLCTAAYVALSIAGGVLMGRCVEKPALALRDHWFPRRSSSRLGLLPGHAPRVKCRTFARRWSAELFIVSCASLLGLLAITWCFPCPEVDDAFYKSPAAELAQFGRLAIPCSSGFLPRMEEVFACYPPMFQLILAAWYSVFGVSLRSSIGFSFLVHALNSVAITFLSKRLYQACSASDQLADPASSVKARVGDMLLPCSTGLIHLCNIAFLDRQEELALLFFWPLLVLLELKDKLRWRTATLCGTLIGCAALTSPWVGAVTAIYFAVRTVLTAWATDLRHHERIQRVGVLLLVAGGVSLSLVALWYFTLEASFPGVIRQQFVGILQHLKATQMPKSWSERVAALLASFAYSPGQMLGTALIACAAPIILRQSNMPVLAKSIFFAGGLATTLLLLTRPEAYTYLSPIQMILLPMFGVVVGILFRSKNARILELSFVGKMAVTVSVAAAMADVGVALLRATQLPNSERAEAVFASLQRRISPEDKVAVTARHWHAFQGRNEWREAFFSSLESPREVVQCDWLVLTPGSGTPYFLNQFHLVEQVWPSADQRHSYAYRLYRRRDSSTAVQGTTPTKTPAANSAAGVERSH